MGTGLLPSVTEPTSGQYEAGGPLEGREIACKFLPGCGGKPCAKQKPDDVLRSIAINAFSRCNGLALSMIHCCDVGVVFFGLCWSSTSSGLAVGHHAANLSAILGKILSPKCCCKL